MLQTNVEGQSDDQVIYKKGKQIEFEFPYKNIQTKTFKSREQLQHFLHKKAIEIGFFQGRLYTTNTHHDRQVSVLRCKFCPARILTTQDPDKLIVNEFQSIHRHSAKKHDPLFSVMMQFFQENPFCLYLDNLHNFFNYDKVKSKKVQNLYYQRFITFDDIVDKIVFETGIHLETWKNQTGQVYMILMVTPSMKQMYKQYGKCIYFDAFHRFQQLRRSKHYPRYWVKLIFAGLDSNNKLLLFGIGFIANNHFFMYHKNPQIYFTLIDAYFKHLNYEMPQSIITSETNAIIRAIELFKTRRDVQFASLISWPSKLKSIKLQLKQNNFKPQDIKKVIELYYELLKQPQQSKFIQTINQIKQICQYYKQYSILYDFIHDYDRYCFIGFQNKFCGFSLAMTQMLSFSRMSFNLLKRQNFYKHFATLVQYQQILIKRTNKVELTARRSTLQLQLQLKGFIDQLSQNTILFRTSQLINKPCLQKKIFSKLIDNFNFTKKLRTIAQYPQIYLITNTDLDDPHIVFFINSTQKWICSCMYFEKIGIPCCHLLKVILNQNIDVRDYFNPRYLKSYTIQKPNVASKSISRKKRRHQN